MGNAYIGRGHQKRQRVVSKEFNIDNGAGTTDDDLLLYTRHKGLTIHNIDVVYTEATDSSMGTATLKVGSSQGGTQIVAAYTHLESAAVSSVAAMTLATSRLESGGVLWARHTGIATTQTGKYKVVVEFTPDA